MTDTFTHVEVNPDLRYFIASLLKGPLYQAQDPEGWARLLELYPHIESYVQVIGFTMIIDTDEGYAYLRSRPDDEVCPGRKPPRLVARRSLPFHVSLLLALLRRRLADFDTKGGETRLVLTRDDLLEMLRVFLPATHNEVKLSSTVEAHINKIVELGFLRPLSTAGSPRAQGAYEVDRILKAFVDGQWLSQLNERLADYRAHVEAETDETDETDETESANE